MVTSPSVFPFAHIVAFGSYHGGSRAARAGCPAAALQDAFADCLLVAVVVGISVVVWRSAGNTGALNNDPIPVVSPNDVLCPLVT